jgi:hypothetical protein
VWKPELWLALVRVATGALVLRLAWAAFTLATVGRAVPIPYPVVSPEFLAAHASRLGEVAVQTPVAWHRDVVKGTLLPRAPLVARAQAWAEAAVGVSLIVGFLTGLAALVGLALTLHADLVAVLTRTGPDPVEWYLPVAMLALLGSRAGRAWGLDAVLRRRLKGLLRFLLAPWT